MFPWSSTHVSLVTLHFELSVKTHSCGFDCIVHRLAILNWFSHFNGIFRTKWFIGSATWRSWCFRWWSVKFRIIVRNGRFLKRKAKITIIRQHQVQSTKLECYFWQNTLKSTECFQRNLFLGFWGCIIFTKQRKQNYGRCIAYFSRNMQPDHKQLDFPSLPNNTKP